MAAMTGTEPLYVACTMDQPNSLPLLDALRLARDLCVGVASFFASADGTVIMSVSPDLDGTDTAERVRALAKRCLSHPMSQGRQFFANAELNREGLSDDLSLACVVSPIWAGEDWLGVIGVADTWLPELNDDQRFGLQRLGNILARRVAENGAGSKGAPDRSEERRAARLPPLLETRAEEPVSGPRSFSIGGAVPSRREESLFSEVADVLPEALVVCRLDGTVVYVNHMFKELTGFEPDEVLGQDIALLLISPDDQMLSEHNDEDLTEFLVGQPSPGRQLTVVTRNGHLAVEVTGGRAEIASVGPCYAALLERQSRTPPSPELAPLGEWSLEAAFDSLDEGVVVCDSHGVVRFINQAARELQGIGPDEDLVGHIFPATAGLYSSNEILLTREQHPLARALRGTVVRGEHLRTGPDEQDRRHVLASAQPLTVAGGRGALLVIRDVTSQTVEQARLTHLALHDPLTGLANRNLLLDHLQRILGDTRNQGGVAALIFLDLDGFKQINDQYGHDVGDEVLVAFSRRLLGAVRTSDIVARLGGDEFVVAHTSSGDESELHQVMARIRKTLSVPYQVRSQTLAVTCSIGWVIADPMTDDPTDLLVRADHEMYRAKRSRLTDDGVA